MTCGRLKSLTFITILKTSGVLIPNNVKSIAKEAESIFSKAKEKLGWIPNRMSFNTHIKPGYPIQGRLTALNCFGIMTI